MAHFIPLTNIKDGNPVRINMDSILTYYADTSKTGQHMTQVVWSFAPEGGPLQSMHAKETPEQIDALLRIRV